MFVRLLLFILFIIPIFAHSAIILKIKGNRCFVHLEGTSAVVGDYFTALDLFGKPRGIIRLDKVKNDKAIATLIDGRADINWLLERTSQTRLESMTDTSTSSRKNKIGFMGSFSWVTVKKGYRGNIQRQHGWGLGPLLFFEWPFHKLFSLNIAGHLPYYNIDSQLSEGSASYSSRRTNRSLQMFNPALQLTVKLHIPIADKTKVWMSGGGSYAKWNNMNDSYDIIEKQNFTFQPAGQILLGVDSHLSNTKYTLSASIGYVCIQCGGEWFAENILGKAPKSDRTSVNISEIIFHIGISQPL